MAGDKEGRQGNTQPFAKFHFSVEWDAGEQVGFSEVDGLGADAEVIGYRHGDSPVFYPIKMPGLGRVGNVTLRIGTLAKDSTFWSWYSGIKMNTAERRTVVVRLLDEAGAPKLVWTLHEAWPVKVTGGDLTSQGNVVAVESIEFAFETVDVKAT